MPYGSPRDKQREEELQFSQLSYKMIARITNDYSPIRGSGENMLLLEPHESSGKLCNSWNRSLGGVEFPPSSCNDHIWSTIDQKPQETSEQLQWALEASWDKIMLQDCLVASHEERIRSFEHPSPHNDRSIGTISCAPYMFCLDHEGLLIKIQALRSFLWAPKGQDGDVLVTSAWWNITSLCQYSWS